MKRNEFDAAFSAIDERYLEDAAKLLIQKPKKSKLRYLLIAAAALALCALAVGGFAVYADEAEYRKAVAYFAENDLDTDGLTRGEIKTIYQDIITGRYEPEEIGRLLKHSETQTKKQTPSAASGASGHETPPCTSSEQVEPTALPTTHPPVVEPPIYPNQAWVKYVSSGEYGEYLRQQVEADVIVLQGGGPKTVEYGSDYKPSAFQLYPETGERRLVLRYAVDAGELDMRVSDGEENKWYWEIWYRDEDPDGDFRRVVMQAVSYSEQPGAENKVVYDLPFYEAGMTDLSLREGETQHEFEFVILIHRLENPDDTFSYDTMTAIRVDWFCYTDSSEAFIRETIENTVDMLVEDLPRDTDYTGGPPTECTRCELDENRLACLNDSQGEPFQRDLFRLHTV